MKQLKSVSSITNRNKNYSDMNEKEFFNLADQFAVSGRSSQLNPLFVSEMMGFPVNWTVLPFLPGAEKASKPTGTR